MATPPRIAVVSSIYGSYDRVKEPQGSTYTGVDFFLFTDQTEQSDRAQSQWHYIHEDYACDNVIQEVRFSVHSPLDAVRHMMRAKYYKTQAFHIQFLQDYDYIIWIDGAFEIKAVNLAAFCTHVMKDDVPVAFFGHSKRQNIIQEVIASQASQKRYRSLPLMQQLFHYIKDGYNPYKHQTLLEMGLFIYRPQATRARNLLDTWWQEIQYHGYQDQISMPYVLWKQHTHFNIISHAIHNNAIAVHRGHVQHSNVRATTNTQETLCLDPPPQAYSLFSTLLIPTVSVSLLKTYMTYLIGDDTQPLEEKGPTSTSSSSSYWTEHKHVAALQRLVQRAFLVKNDRIATSFRKDQDVVYVSDPVQVRNYCATPGEFQDFLLGYDISPESVVKVEDCLGYPPPSAHHEVATPSLLELQLQNQWSLPGLAQWCQSLRLRSSLDVISVFSQSLFPVWMLQLYALRRLQKETQCALFFLSNHMYLSYHFYARLFPDAPVQCLWFSHLMAQEGTELYVRYVKEQIHATSLPNIVVVDLCERYAESWCTFCETHQLGDHLSYKSLFGKQTDRAHLTSEKQTPLSLLAYSPHGSFIRLEEMSVVPSTTTELQVVSKACVPPTDLSIRIFYQNLLQTILYDVPLFQPLLLCSELATWEVSTCVRVMSQIWECADVVALSHIAPTWSTGPRTPQNPAPPESFSTNKSLRSWIHTTSPALWLQEMEKHIEASVSTTTLSDVAAITKVEDVTAKRNTLSSSTTAAASHKWWPVGGMLFLQSLVGVSSWWFHTYK